MSAKKSSNSIAAIIPAAGKPSNRILAHSALPDTMIPINGKPVIGYILEDLLARGIFKAILCLHPDDAHTQKYAEQKFSSKMELDFVKVATERGVGHSIFLAAQKLKGAASVLIYLGDTIYKGPLNFSGSFLVSSKKWENPQAWCFAEKKSNGRLQFINKPLEYQGSGSVLSGLYFFKRGKDFLAAAKAAEKQVKKIEVSDILERYQKSDKFNLVPANKWYDCGNIENYYQAKVDFLRIRSFNHLSYDAKLGIITKSGSNPRKILQEINWYKNTPAELKIFAPRLFGYKTGKHPQYSVEYYGYPNLADIFMFAYINPAIWDSIIARLFEIINLFKKHKSDLPIAAYKEMYVNKTRARLAELKHQPYWKDVFSEEEIVINDVAYKNFSAFDGKLEAMAKKLFRKSETAFIHGDMCLGNILYDVDSRLVKLIDPRGSFGKPGVYGDLKYDLAKLRHSLNGRYDFIVADLFKIEEPKQGNFFYSPFAEDYHDRIAQMFDRQLARQGFNINEIKFIEALLFLSMLPLHSGNTKRQQAMFVTGIKLLNEVKF